MNIDMQALLTDHRIAVADTNDKHYRQGWLNVDCPFCADKKKHLGWDIRGQRWNCWKCGSHNVNDTLTELLNAAYYELDAVKRRYALRPGALADNGDEAIVRPAEIVVPGHSPLGLVHESYLIGRNYDPDKLQRVWELRGTAHVDRGTNKFRIVCPIYYDGHIVSWQGRDITGRSPLRWKSCPAELELRAHKHCLGGEQLVPGDSVAVVEGFTDAWRLGPGAVATFGTAYLTEQVNLLRRYRHRFIVLDSENKDPNAGLQADKLAAMLSAFPGETIMVELDGGDPGDLAQAEADYLMTKEWGIR